MILEAVMTTINADGSVNIAPMGPHFDWNSDYFELRPFEGSTTWINLRRDGQGVLHVTDDVQLFANAVTRNWPEMPPTHRAETIEGEVLVDCCRWYEFRVASCTPTPPRWSMHCEILNRGRRRDFFGFNRAKHAVIEAAILATRLDFLPEAQVAEEFERLRPLVQKTGGRDEREAFEKLSAFVRLQREVSRSQGTTSNAESATELHREP